MRYALTSLNVQDMSDLRYALTSLNVQEMNDLRYVLTSLNVQEMSDMRYALTEQKREIHLLKEIVKANKKYIIGAEKIHVDRKLDFLIFFKLLLPCINLSF